MTANKISAIPRSHVNPEGDSYPTTRADDDPGHSPGGSGHTPTAEQGFGSIQDEYDGLLQGLQRPDPKVQTRHTHGGDPDGLQGQHLRVHGKSPSVSWYLKKATGLDSGSSRPKHMVASELSVRHLYEIAKVKQSDSYCQYMPLESICKSIIGTANSMGIKIVKDLD
ncbi:54S ribosomal protein L19 mitochondrial [Prunus yedoensis var. nudiflora]|uniref:Large ribosomal subunit protein uL11m n=1 Tax=Prunus yedoensis var. nudiflora TaxID=2094558 RepID=A0A314Z9A7_PRUYE|nr:54S ribosomal protein L19 mitochondrial [Prunus yedoensis var. nudiflora]